MFPEAQVLLIGGEKHVPLALDSAQPCVYPLTPKAKLLPRLH